jgi:hypothetical protein
MYPLTKACAVLQDFGQQRCLEYVAALGRQGKSRHVCASCLLLHAAIGGSELGKRPVKCEASNQRILDDPLWKGRTSNEGLILLS